MDDSCFHMIDVSAKEATPRRARARGRILMAPGTAQRIARRDMPKGDVLAMAEIAGIMAVKNTALLLPLCHPLPIESVKLVCRVRDDGVEVACEVKTISKTGVEMEALCGAQAALLAIYDLTKIVDPALEISDLRLEFKEGGKSGFWSHPKSESQAATPASVHADAGGSFKGLRVAVITISDRCSRGESEDRSGPRLCELAKGDGAEIVGHRLVSDDIAEIRRAVGDSLEFGVDVILTTGGTGPGVRDVTPEALHGLVEKEFRGIGELLRFFGGTSGTKCSYLSRSLGGLIGDRLIIAFPGSVRAVTEGYWAVRDLIPHAVIRAQGREPRQKCGG